MNTFSQIVVDLTALAIAFVVGSLFDTAFWQISYHAQHLSGGKPLPLITEFLIEHHHLAYYLAIIPWFWLVAAPLLNLHSALHYWEPTAFILRFLAFTCCEILLILFLGLFAALPFVGFYLVMQSSQETTLDLAAAVLFWSSTAVILCGAIYRTIQVHRHSAR